MRLRRGSASFVACISLSCVSVDLALAQDAETEATPLPPVTVETQAAAPKAKKKAANKKSSTAKAAVPSQQPAVAAQKPAGIPRTSDGTAHGPVEGYVAENTATGIKTNTPLNEIPQSISVVGTEQMRDQGVQTMQDALRYVPGVVAESHGTDSRSDGYFIRGIAPAEYLDGLRRNFDTFYFGYRLEPYMMERVEVLRGPASVLYGQASVGGILNAVSKRPHGDTGGEITAEYGSFDFKQVKFDHSGLITSDGKLSYRVTGLARDSGTQTNHVDNDRYTIQPAITWRPDKDTTVTFLGYFQKDRSGSTQQIFPRVGTLFPNVNGKRIPIDSFIGEPGDYYDTDVASGSLFIEHNITSSLKLKHVSRYTDSSNKYDVKYPAVWGYIDAAQEEVARARGVSDSGTRTFSQDTNLETWFSTGPVQHRIVGGVDYTNFKTNRTSTNYIGFNSALANLDFINVYNPKYGNNEWIPFSCALGCMDDQKISQTGLYLQDQMRLGNWIAVLGVRHDWAENETTNRAPPAATKHVSQKSEATTYRAGLMYEFSFGLTPYVNYAESFIPVPGVTAPASGSKPFDPQTGRMYEAGFKFQPKGANFAVNGSVFDIAETGRVVAGATDLALQNGFTDRIEANAMESNGKSLAEQHLELQQMQMKDPQRYALPETQAKLDKILETRIKRGELDEFGREVPKRRRA